MNEEIIDYVLKKTIHIKSRPTMKSISELYITLSSAGYAINKLKYGEYNYVDIIDYCNYIENLVKKKNKTEKNTTKNKYIHIKFKENDLIPQQVYIDEENEDDKDYQFIVDDGIILSDSESDNDSESEQNNENDIDDGDEYYDSGNDEFSE